MLFSTSGGNLIPFLKLFLDPITLFLKGGSFPVTRIKAPTQAVTENWSSGRLLLESHATLIVAPASLVGQWMQELEDKSRNLLKLLSFTSDSKSYAVRDMAEKHVVVAPYSMLHCSQFFEIKWCFFLLLFLFCFG